MPGIARKTLRSDYTRVWIAEGGAGPGRPFEYQESAIPGEVRWDDSEPTDLEIPDPDNLGEFLKVDQLPGEEQKPSLPIVGRFPANRESVLTRIRRRRCLNDVQVHIGTCDDPRDFDDSWTNGKALVIETARLTGFSTDRLGALQSSERAFVNENGTFTGLDYYEIFGLAYSEQAASNVAGEVIEVVVCDRPSCQGQCGSGSDGCQQVFAVTLDLGSIGAGTGVVWTRNGGRTWTNSAVAELGGDPVAAACAGRYLIILSQAGGSHVIAERADIVAGAETWVEVTDGYDGSGGPNAIFSIGAAVNWIVGQSGFVYFSDNLASGVEVALEGGSVTAQNLLAVHGLNADEILIGGASNVILHTENGGESFTLITGPEPGAAINTVVMRDREEWIVGTSTGRIYYTEDGGDTWEESGFSGQGTGVVERIVFSTKQVGYMSHTVGGAGRIFRSINGGQTWVLQDNSVETDRINSLATCQNPNRVFAGGLGGDGSDGVLIKGA